MSCNFKPDINKPNTYYGMDGAGDVGKVFRNRSFGGAMSNRKITKQQVIQHKLQPKNIRNGVTTIKLDNTNPKRYIPPLIPRILGSIENPEYRSGYMTNKNFVELPKNNNYTQYFFPMQQLQKTHFNPKQLQTQKYNSNSNYNTDILFNIPINQIKNIDVTGDYVKYPLNETPYKYTEQFNNIQYKQYKENNFYNSTLSMRTCINKNNNTY